MNSYLGIDPGLDGGIAIISDDFPIKLYPMPTTALAKGRVVDAHELGRLIHNANCNSGGNLYIALEKVSARPGQGVTSMFSFGQAYGICLGIFGALGLSYRLYRPQEWQGNILKGHPKGSEVAVAKALWPHACWLASDKCRVPHSGMVDAALIARHCQMQHQSNL